MRFASLIGLTLLSGCVTGNYSRFEDFSPPRAGALASLEVGQSDMEQCLQGLGAPLIVREDGDHTVLAWGWRKQNDWTVGLSIPVTDLYSASLTYNDVTVKLHGVVGFFDEDWQLVELRTGYLNDLLERPRARPQLLEARPANGHE